MPIQCQICERKFKKVITGTHLKTHGITGAEYKEKYGKTSLASPEYIKERSEKYSGSNNPMYGKSHSNETVQKISSNRAGKVGRTGEYSEDGLKKIREAVIKREERYNSGELVRPTISHSQETKEKISESVKEYAKNNAELLSIRGIQAHESAKRSGKWKAPMTRLKETDRDKYNKHRENSRKFIKEANNKRSINLKKKIDDRIYESNLSILNETLSEISNLWTYELKCLKCNTIFNFTRQYFTDSKFNEKICPTCFPRIKKVSIGEQEVFDYVKTLCDNVIQNDRSVLNGMELDLYCPDLKLAIEYNGLYWHSESVLKYNGSDKMKDYHKFKELSAKGIELINIYEDEWNQSKDIVKSILCNKFGKTSQRIFARNCIIRELDVKSAREFLESNHLQGYNKCKIRLGLYHDDILVSVMSFSKGNLSRKSEDWEIDRFATLRDTIVIGGASKLWKRFIDMINPSVVVSYADNRWSSGSVYKQLGFEKINNTNPSYWYFLPNEAKRIHRYTLRKNSSDDPDITEYQNRLKQGYLRVWDCGNSKWIWRNKKALN